MYQTDRGNYNKKPSMAHSMVHSCFGKMIILAVIFFVLLLVAYLTVPSDETMRYEMTDNIVQCVADNDSIKADGIDAFVNNIGYTFTYADSSQVKSDVLATFNKYNKMEFYRHAFYSTAYVYNNFRPEGTRIGVGLFGLVIPTVKVSDLVLRVGPMHKGYDQKLIRQSTDRDDYMGENPDLGIFHEPVAR